MYKNSFIVILILLLNGCASKTVDLVPKPISKEEYEKYSAYNCNQVDNSLSFLEIKAQRIARVQNDDAKSDVILLSWGWMLYGVPYLFLDGNGKAKEEFETILGQKEALEELMIAKDCRVERHYIEHKYDGSY
ncbi:MAG: hypothetical protein WBK95_10740 [Sulfurimonas sp.]|nr:hypothetical protein [Sulfurimonas sp.]MDD3059650.1 hypothetical protein [Sulfurimonas sp.]MDD5202874.1 hypothetical protein [Sulfurimonas sp.]